jgi:nicotinate-nucleotide adenylyltransferase
LRLAIFGGTFDPVHNAHLAIARAAADGLSLDRVLFVPAAHPPHKRGVTHAPFEHRLRMVELAVAADQRFEASRIEESTSRSYSIDTIERVRASLSSEDELYFLIGADAFAEIRTWHRWRDVVQAVRFIVVSRPGFPIAVPISVEYDRIDTIALPISSSEIRRALAAGERTTTLPEPVLNYALTHDLYK